MALVTALPVHRLLSCHQNGNIILSGSYNAYTYIGDTNWGTGVFNSGSTYYNEVKGWWHDGNNRGFRLYNSYNNTIPFFVNSNGNVGIGTTNPSNKLTVYNNGLSSSFKTASSGWSSYIGFKNDPDNKTAYIGMDGIGL